MEEQDIVAPEAEAPLEDLLEAEAEEAREEVGEEVVV